eukprot:SAG31_NODE_2913_length_4920_cov_2.535988_3_plen_74_part_00
MRLPPALRSKTTVVSASGAEAKRSGHSGRRWHSRKREEKRRSNVSHNPSLMFNAALSQLKNILSRRDVCAVNA